MDELFKARHDAAETLFSMVDLPSTVVDSPDGNLSGTI